MILVLAGTADGRSIINKLNKCGLQVLATAVSCYGKSLISRYDGVEVVQGALLSEELFSLIRDKDIKTVIDATHPFALRVSLMAMEVCRSAGVLYIRYERAKTRANGSGNIIRVPDFSEAALRAGEYGNVFLTIGVKNLEPFVERIPVDRLVARVLPFSGSINKCAGLGLSPGNVIAMEGPFSRELNRELFKKYKAGVVVTKDSGETGGTKEKLLAAQDLKIPVIMVTRPRIEYPLVVHNIKSLMEELGR